MNFFLILARKFTYAWRGLCYVARREFSFKLELAVALGALGLAWWFQFTPFSWALLLLTVAVVLAAEIVNTVLERLMDLIEPRLLLHIALLKDMLAGALLIIVLAAALIGWLLLRLSIAG